MKVCHLTSVHPRYEIRIFIKECQSLSKAGYDVSLIVADNKGDEIINNIKIIDVGKSKGRLRRMTQTIWRVYKKALKLDADIYQFHDPELLFIGLLLKHKGKKVVYDIHEDVPRAIFDKLWINKYLVILISKIFERIENFISKRLTYNVTATPYLRDRFLKINKNTIDINNYPIISEFNNNDSWQEKKNEICLTGSISEVRGIIQLINVLEICDTRLHLAGEFSEPFLEEKVRLKKGWEKVIYYGFIGRDKVKQIFNESKIGMAIILPDRNLINGQPIKIFEYMSAGIPVICSDFPLWKRIVENNNCGICVNPLDIQEIAKAINYLLNNEEEAKQMGLNGKRAIIDKYNWNKEEERLLKLYSELKKCNVN